MLRTLALSAALLGCAREPAPAPPVGPPLDIAPLPARQTPSIPFRRTSLPDFDLPDGCHGRHLTSTGSISRCDCHEQLIVDGGVRADLWCGPPRPLERATPTVTVETRPDEVHPGDPFRVLIVVSNPSSTERVIYRLRGQHFPVEIRAADGSALPRSVFTSAPARDEALIGLEPDGSLAVTLDLVAVHQEWSATKQVVVRPLPRGHYEVRISLGGLIGASDFMEAQLDVR